MFKNFFHVQLKKDRLEIEKQKIDRGKKCFQLKRKKIRKVLKV